jgi:hypothetical protein
MFCLRAAIWFFFLLAFIPFCLAASDDFSFTITTRQGNEVATGKVYVKHQKYRFERDGETEYAIVREDMNRAWLINPQKRSYTEMLYNSSYRPRIDEKDPAEIDRTYLGIETINGRKTFKYDITMQQDKKRKRFYQWTDAQLRLPVRIEDAEGGWTVEYSDFREFVSDNLFELPGDYSLSQGWTAPFMRIYSIVWLISGALFAFHYIYQRLQQRGTLS